MNQSPRRRNSDANLEKLRALLADKPELTQRFAAIATLASEPDLQGRIRSADEVESLLVEEVRKMGNRRLASWAQGVDSQISAQIRSREKRTRMREEKR
jgi:CHASE3 domain sensor protein